jgi:hypothetical protein
MDLYKIYTKRVTKIPSETDAKKGFCGQTANTLFKVARILSLLLVILLATNSAHASSAGLTLFTTQDAAQSHCPNDEVVWLNLPTGIWHTKWQRWYGNTKHGAYVCKEEAADAGNRASRHG